MKAYRIPLVVLACVLLVWLSGGTSAQAPRGVEEEGAGSSLQAGAAVVPSALPRIPDSGEPVPPRGYEEDLDSLKAEPAPAGPLPRIENDAAAIAAGPEPSAPPLVTNFQGIQDTGSFPPDPNFAAGPSHVIQAVNRSFRISNKAGTTLSTTTFASWWSPVITGVSPFDPWVQWDQHSNRWVLLTVARNIPADQAWYLISTSWTSDPTGGWCVWALRADFDGGTDTSNWADYPKLGLDNTNFYITSNQFTFSGNNFQYAKLRTMNKTQFYNNTCGGIAWWDNWSMNNADGSNAFTLQPALTFGTPGKEYMVNSRSGSGSNVTLWSVTGTWPNASNTPPVLTREATVSVGSYGAPPNAQQSGSATALDTGDARLLNAVYRSGVLYTTHTIGWNANADSRARFLSINVSTELADIDAAYGADGTFYFYPAIMPDPGGNIFTVFNRSSSTEFAAMRYTWRPSGGAAFESSAQLKAGEASYVQLDTLGRNRFGDYSGIALDPTDNLVWIYAEYAESPANNWGTWVGQVGVAPTPCPASIALSGASTRTATVDTLHRLRDNALSRTPLGQQYIRLFYRHAPELSRLLLRDAGLRVQTRQLLSELAPTLRAVASGQPTALSQAQLAAIEDLMDRFAEKGSWRLRMAIRVLRSQLRRGNLLSHFSVRVEDAQ